MKFTTTTAAFPSLILHNADGPVTDFTMTFIEGFATEFKPRSAAIRPDDTSINANQNIPGNQFTSASGFYNASFTGTYAGIGLAAPGRLVRAGVIHKNPAHQIAALQKNAGALPRHETLAPPIAFTHRSPAPWLAKCNRAAPVRNSAKQFRAVHNAPAASVHP